MRGDTWLTQLRVSGADASAVERLLADGAPDDGLQHAGQAVLRCSLSTGLIATAETLIESLSGFSPHRLLVGFKRRATGKLAGGLPLGPFQAEFLKEPDQSPIEEDTDRDPRGVRARFTPRTPEPSELNTGKFREGEQEKESDK